MATFFLAPGPLQDTFFIPGSNTPGNGAQLFIYTAGSTTKVTVFKDNGGAASWSNPIVLDSGGNLPSGGVIWIPSGTMIKAVYAPYNDTDPPGSPYRTIDNISGINDIASQIQVAEWVQAGTPTYIGATQFSLVGDQRAIFDNNRRVKALVTAGTVYGTVTSQTFASGSTTITEVLDSGALDAGLSAAYSGLLDPANPSLTAFGVDFRAPASTSVLRTLQSRLQDTVSVIDFGATGNGSTDDTAAIQAGINYCRTNHATLYVPPGTYVISTLDLTQGTGFSVVGAGRGVTTFMPKSGTVAYSTSVGHLFDLTGSFFLSLENFQIGAFNQTPVPATAFFCAQTSTNSSNYLFWKNVYATGKYRVATIYNTSVESCRLLDCEFYNYQNSSASTLYFSKNNIAGLTSAYATMSSSALVPNDWTFVGCEIHDFTENASSVALNLDQVATLRFIGGNISAAASAGQYMSMQNGASNLVFDGTTFYSDIGPAPNYVINNVGGITGIRFDQCSLQYNTAVLVGAGAFSAGSSALEKNFHSTPATVVPASSTVYLGAAGHDATEANVYMQIGRPAIISNLRVQTTGGPGTGASYTFTARRNASSQVLTCSTASTSISASDLAHYFQVAAGDNIDILMVLSSSSASTQAVTATFDYMPLS